MNDSSLLSDARAYSHARTHARTFVKENVLHRGVRADEWDRLAGCERCRDEGWTRDDANRGSTRFVIVNEINIIDDVEEWGRRRRSCDDDEATESVFHRGVVFDDDDDDDDA